MNNINMMNAMVVVIENGLPTCIGFMEAIRNKGIENDLKGWWWSSDKGLISDPSESEEFVVKAQTIYDALMGKPVYVNGVRLFHKQSPIEIRAIMDVHQVNLLEQPKDYPR